MGPQDPKDVTRDTARDLSALVGELAALKADATHWLTDPEYATLRHRLIMAGLSFLALAILGVVFLISELMVGGAGALAATLGIGLVFLWVWYGQPLLRMRG